MVGPADAVKHEGDQHIEHIKPTQDGKIDALLGGEFQSMRVEDRQAALELARQIDPGPPILSMRYFGFVLTCLCTCMCSGDNGELFELRDLNC